MKGKFLWLGLSCLVTLSLVLAACAPAPTEEEKAVTEEEVVTEKEVVTEEKAVTEKAVTPAAEKPRYGGVAVIGLTRDNYGFDEVYLGANWHMPQTLVYDELLMGDWTRGPAGTGETDFINTGFAPDGFFRDTGALAESWEIPDNQTLIYKIRKGIHWQNKPPVNGREYTAADAVFNIKRHYLNPKALVTYNLLGAPGSKKVTDVYIDPNDKWTVVVKVDDLAVMFLEDMGDKSWHYAPEVYEKYGDAKDWRNAVGTGPFMLTDYVAGSSYTFVRSPNYWMMDPVGPGKGNQLPYLDGVRALIIPDKSTRVAALRTGKIDQIGAYGASGVISGSDALEWEDVENLLGTTPHLKFVDSIGGSRVLTVRTTSKDPLAAPMMKQRVRQALMMAIDQEAILRDYYKGKGAPYAVMFAPGSPYYSSLDEMVEILQRVHGFKPEEAQVLKKMYGYYPEEAKKILAEEGYPNGFKTHLVLTVPDVDFYSIVKGYWANIGVDLVFDVREFAVYQSISRGHTFPAFVSGGLAAVGWPERWFSFGPSDPNAPRYPVNPGEFNEPVVNDAISRSEAVYGDYKATSQIIKETEPYIFWLAWNIIMPSPASYTVWQPWLKNYHGEFGIGYRSHWNWLFFSWYDQELKEQMGF